MAIADGQWHSFGNAHAAFAGTSHFGGNPGLIRAGYGGFGYGGWGYRGYGFGCWGCGWGFGFGWGPAWGFAWDPFWAFYPYPYWGDANPYWGAAWWGDPYNYPASYIYPYGD